MRLLLTILLVVFGTFLNAQTRPTGTPTQFNLGWQRWGYSMSDSGTIIARRDTLNFFPRFSGTTVMRPQDRGLYYYDSTLLKWNKLLISSDVPANQNFANADLTLTGNRNHAFSTNSMRFNFQYTLGNDGYIGFNESSMPGITINSKSDVETPGIYFIDPDAPTATSVLGNFLGTLTLGSGNGGNSGNISVYGNGVSLSAVNALGRQKSIIFTPSGGVKGLSVTDQQDTTGLYYGGDYSIDGIANHGDRWIPDLGAIQGLFFKQNGNAFGDTARLGTNDNNPLVFKLNNVSKGILTQSGRLGIGTLNPLVNLDIRDSTSNVSVLLRPGVSSSSLLRLDGAVGTLQFNAPISTIQTPANNFSISQPSLMGVIGSYNWINFSNPNQNQTTGNGVGIRSDQTFAPASGTATHTSLLIAGAISQTGGANGITWGIKINPTLASAVDYRALQIDSGSVYMNKDFLPILSTLGPNYYVTIDTVTNQIKRTLIAGGGGGGTVTNIATGYGLLGGPITTTGTLEADTTRGTGLPTYFYADSLNNTPTQAGNPYKFLRTNGATSSWQFPLEWVDIRTFGAVGDSSTDCTVAIQNAINSLPSTGGTIFIPNGKWRVSGKITVDRPVYFKGSAGPIHSYQTGEHSAVLGESRCVIFYSADTDTCLLIQRNNCQFENFSISYSGVSVSRTCVGIYMDSATDMRMENVGILKFSVNVEIENGFQWLIDKCAFIDPKIASLKISDSLLHDAGDMSVMNSYFNVNTSFGNNSTSLYWRSGGGLRLINNKFNGAGAGNYPIYHVYSPFQGSVDLLINANSFENYSRNAIFFQPAALVQTLSLVINNNQFASYTSKLNPDIVLDGTIATSIQNVVISGNVFRGNNTDTAISIKKIQDLQISGNQINNYSRYITNDNLGSNNTVVPPLQRQILTYGATTTWDVNKGSTGELTLTGNTSIALQNASDGQRLTLIVSQDATGSRVITFPGFDIIGNSKALNPTPSSTSVITGIMRGATTFIVDNAGRAFTTGSILSYNSGVTEATQLYYDFTNNRLGLNTSTSPTTQLNVSSDVNDVANGVTIENHVLSNAGNRITFKKSYGTRASPLVGASGNYNSMIAFDTYDGSAYRRTSSIFTVVQGAISSGVVPVGIGFRTGSADVPDPVGSSLVNFWWSPLGNFAINKNMVDNGRKLAVNGSVEIEKDSIPIPASTAGMYVLLQDTTATADSNRIKRILPANMGFATGNTLYTGDGTLSGVRTVTMSGNTINFSGGDVGIDIAPLYDFHIENSTATTNNISTAALGTNSGAKEKLSVKALPTTAADVLGSLEFTSRNGANDDLVGAQFRAIAEGAWTATTNMPTAFVWRSVATSTMVEKMRLNSAGNLGIGITNPTGRVHPAAGTTTIPFFRTPLGVDMTTPLSGSWSFATLSSVDRLAFSPAGTTYKRFPLMNDVTPSAGGILQGNATDFTLLALGTANQLLRVNAGATALEYFTPTFVSSNIYTANGNLTGDRQLSGIELYDLRLISLDTFYVSTLGKVIFDGPVKMAQTLEECITVSSSGTVSIGNCINYIGSGTTATYTLPTGIAALVGRVYTIKNRGSGNITVDVADASSTIYDTGAVASVIVVPGAARTFKYDGSFWVML